MKRIQCLRAAVFCYRHTAVKQLPYSWKYLRHSTLLNNSASAVFNARVCHLHLSSKIYQHESNSSPTFDVDSLFGDEDLEPSYADETSFIKQSGGRDDNFGALLEKVNYDGVDLDVFPKHVYKEHAITADRTMEEIKEFYKEHSISLSGENAPKPILTKEEADFPHNLSQALEKFRKPTPIQSVAWPVTLSGRNVIGIAQTGSGKTLSFLIPAVIHIKEQMELQPGEGPIALVLCPTRELARQGFFLAKYAFSNVIRSACLYGGGQRMQQMDALRAGCDLVFATPGRLTDLLQCKALTLRRCTFLVLDEADRMLDMGFEPQIRRIIDQIRPDRQVTMWSATWPASVRKLASHYLMSEEDPIHIKVGSSELAANKDVKQIFKICSSKKKMALLPEELQNCIASFQERVTKYNDSEEAKTWRPKMLIFANTKSSCKYLAYLLNKQGINSSALHGDLSQRNRDDVLRDFRTGQVNALIATDVAARGLDVRNIQFVVNYDMPLNCVDYIHRIGRTGRGGKKGTAITFLTELDGAVVPDLIKSLEDIGHDVDDKLTRMEQWWKEQRHSMKKRTNESVKRRTFSRGSGYSDFSRGSKRFENRRGDDYGYDNRHYNNDGSWGKY
ncbi:unnamed protein product [Clavelina lepadiformis]|uniref:RNA helicase n=1 Tax=Clavelina lepadiformis TaxID=159417 RepID=A0ABP0H3M7_CLALP